MDEPKSLDSLFKEKIFRIPDYQRGYAWRHEQLKDFWEDLMNLAEGRSHYTGVLTLKELPSRDIKQQDKEFWLIDDYSYKLYHIVDGQQRLTTFVIFLQSFVELFKGLPENKGKTDQAIYLTDTLNISAVQEKYLFRVKPAGDRFRTYKFGYTVDNPSYEYLRYRVLNEPGKGSLQETFYTLNLTNAKDYFSTQLRDLYEQEGQKSLQDVYARLTKRFLFNEYVIKDEFDVFVAFETMNNRGKKLSDLELLKNRLIYLTTLYADKELDPAERASLRTRVNEAWKEVYYQLGRNKNKPLNDDDFLRAHWTMYFKYSRKTGQDYIHFLLDEQFTPQKIHKKVEHEVTLEKAEEQRAELDMEAIEDENGDEPEKQPRTKVAQLRPKEIRDYVLSLKQCAVHWFNTFYPALAEGLTPKEREWIDRINRVGMGYFRPLVMAILKQDQTPGSRIRLFKKIERFIFVAFRLSASRANYRSSEFYNAARALDRGEISFEDIEQRLDHDLGYTLNEDGSLRIEEFYNLLFKKFKSGSGYYGWAGLRYFLYEYELSLMEASVQQKVSWDDLLKTDKDKISIEHIYPQTETSEWAKLFKGINKKTRTAYSGSLGNLLLLSQAINSALQNDAFQVKKTAKIASNGQKLRHGYYDGSHSEIEVAQYAEWGPEQIRERGATLLKFMESRWGLLLRDDDRDRLLFLGSGE
jgi:Protein of unknown function DUF262/Protein of unknown function (DUF1524)